MGYQNMSVPGIVSSLCANTTTDLNSKTYHATLMIWSSATSMLTLLGAVVNLLVLVTLFGHKKMRPGSGLLILHLTAVYFILCAVHMPLGILLVLGNGFHFFLYANCRYVQLFFIASIVASNWTDTMLGINRVVAICFPHKYKPWTSPKVVFPMITICWMFAFGYALTTFFGVGGKTIRLITGQCGFKTEAHIGFVLISVLGTHLAYSISGICSLIVFVEMLILSFDKKNGTVPADMEPGHARKQRVMQHRLVIGRMLLTSYLWCLLCNSPPVIISSIFPEVYVCSWAAGLWTRTTTVCQFAFNPFIFYAMNEDYRQALRNLVFKCRMIAPRNFITLTWSSAVHPHSGPR